MDWSGNMSSKLTSIPNELKFLFMLSGRDKPLWEITLAGGHKIYATEEHKWPVVSGDFVRKVQTSDLAVVL